MERVTTDVGPQRGCKDEVMVKGGIVAHQDGSLAIVVLHRLANGAEDLAESFPLGYRFSLRIPRINTREIKRGLLQIRAFERIDLLNVGFSAPHPAIVVHGQYHCRHFQQGVPLGIEASGFHVDYNRQKPAKAAGHGMRWFVFVSHSSSGLGRV